MEYHHIYKVEKNQKFIQWMLPLLPHKFHSQMDEDLYKIGLLLVKISHYLFNDTRGPMNLFSHVNEYRIHGFDYFKNMKCFTVNLKR
jgi:hypothetical protein